VKSLRCLGRGLRQEQEVHEQNPTVGLKLAGTRVTSKCFLDTVFTKLVILVLLFLTMPSTTKIGEKAVPAIIATFHVMPTTPGRTLLTDSNMTVMKNAQQR